MYIYIGQTDEMATSLVLMGIFEKFFQILKALTSPLFLYIYIHYSTARLYVIVSGTPSELYKILLKVES